MTVAQAEILTEFFKRIYREVCDNYENPTKQKLLDFIVKTYIQMYTETLYEN